MSKWSKIGKSLRKIISWSIRIAVGISALLMIALNLPPVQKRLLDTAVQYVNNKTRHTVSVKSAQINWFDRIQLSDLTIHDLEDSLDPSHLLWDIEGLLDTCECSQSLLVHQLHVLVKRSPPSRAVERLQDHQPSNLDSQT